jgi:oligopeptidase A
MNDMLNRNPLLQDAQGRGLMRFDAIAPEHVAPAIDALLAASRATVARVTAPDTPATWPAVVEPLDDATEALARAWGAVSHLNAVADTPALREQYNAVEPRLTAFWTELSHNTALFEKYKEIAAAPDFASWPPARRRVIENELRDFRLGGAELPPPQKKRFGEILERKAALSTKFSENTLDATGAFALVLPDDTRLEGVPADACQMFREAAAAEGKPGYKLTLHYPAYLPVMQYAHDRALREQMYRAFATRASDLGRPDWDNSALMLETLRLRREQAALLGFAHYAALSLERKMADSADKVTAFLRDLAARARPHAERDLAELREFAAQELNLPALQAWDIAYASERLRESRYAYSEQELKAYFPLPAVLDGLFRVIESLFAVAIKPDTAPLWHADVRFYRIESQRGDLIGQFYLDLHAREHKQDGAWQDDARSRHRRANSVQTPVSFLTCNFARAVGMNGKMRPALLSHDDVLTLFHEFGHGLHHLLTRVDESAVAGIRGVEWDAVELPSQFMENFAWEWEVLQLLTAHVDTGAKLPRQLFDRMIAARNFQSGLLMLRQVEYALFDMRLHTDALPDSAADLQRIAHDVRSEVAVLFPPDWFRGAWTFSHIFAGGYAAGYYSYKWAEVLSADAYALFEEHRAQAATVLNRGAGGRFLDEVLAVGGSRPAMDSFVAFRGRAPTIDALLRHQGLASSVST